MVSEGEDSVAALDQASEIAIGKVREMLGLPELATQVRPAPAAQEPAKRARRTQNQIAEDAAAAEAAKKAGTKPAPVNTAALPDPAAIGDEAAVVDPEKAAFDASIVVDEKPATDPADISFDIEPEGEEITDAKLNEACTKRNADAPGILPKIRELIKTFNPDPTKVFQLREIPQAQRQDFLNKLAELKLPL